MVTKGMQAPRHEGMAALVCWVDRVREGCHPLRRFFFWSTIFFLMEFFFRCAYRLRDGIPNIFLKSVIICEISGSLAINFLNFFARKQGSFVDKG